MPLLEKVDRIRWELMMDPRLSMAGIIREANAAMGLQPMGTLPEQAEALLNTMGAEVPAARPIPIRKLREQPFTKSAHRTSETPDIQL